MENQDASSQAAVNEIYNYAANLLVNEKKSSKDVQTALVGKGLSESAALTIVYNLEVEIKNAKKEAGKKDMLYGALWCVGGAVATVANIGFIFWGAILFGGIQFIKGAVNFFSEG
ncbi:MAG TPA: hypothetical protein VK589_15545 [Chryseolinea sp.]|nr:hypothetical protein [Chryseolinea sp.]